jgi:hypothetical protein
MEFNLQPHLKGELLELRPLAPNDWDELFAVPSGIVTRKMSSEFSSKRH